MKKILGILSFALLCIYLINHSLIAEKALNADLDKDALLTFTSGELVSQSKQPEYKLIYDTLITTLFPSIEKEMINYYGYLKQFEDAKILSITRNYEGGYDFNAEVQVTTFEHAHNPPYG